MVSDIQKNPTIVPDSYPAWSLFDRFSTDWVRVISSWLVLRIIKGKKAKIILSRVVKKGDSAKLSPSGGSFDWQLAG